MKYLNDTCVFINKITNPVLLFDILSHYEKYSDKFCVTDCIIEELIRIGEKDDAKAKIAKAIINTIRISGKRISIIEIEKNETYKKNLKAIRDNYYGHLTDRKSLKDLVDAGICTNSEAKKLWMKDLGECSCVAIAMEDPNNCIIITQDAGNIKFKPNTNIFKIFERSHKVKVWDYDQWVRETKYNKNKSNRKIR
jgi:hypothetical protein